jgi:enediyne polyketide synthase
VDDRTASELLAEVPGFVVVANRNGPGQTVIAGEEAAVGAALARAAELGVNGRRLPVSRAFHTRLIAGAAEVLRSCELLASREHDHRQKEAHGLRLFSSLTGDEVPTEVCLAEHFAAQALAPVDFQALVEQLAGACDQLIEVGPGRVLSGLADGILGQAGTCLPVAGQPDRDADLNRVLARAFALGVAVRWEALYEGRLVRPFVPADQRKFIDNPCERPLTISDAVPLELDAVVSRERPRPDKKEPLAPQQRKTGGRHHDIQDLLLDLAVRRTGFPREAITPERRLLDDLNLDSIKAAELVSSAAKEIGLAGQIDPAQFANATLAEVAAALQALLPERGTSAPGRAEPADPAVVERHLSVAAPTPAGPVWVRAFTVEYVHAPC